MENKIKVIIFQSPYASLRNCGAWDRMHSYENKGKMDVPAEYYMPVFNGEINLPEDIPDVDENRDARILEYIFGKFNLDDKPEGYCGRSLSVCDVVMLGRKAYLCKPMGFRECNFVSSRIDSIPRTPRRSPEVIRKAEQVLIDNGIEADEAETVLQAIGYVLLDEELYPEN